MVGYNALGVDRFAKEGLIFTDNYAGLSSTMELAAFTNVQHFLRTGLKK